MLRIKLMPRFGVVIALFMLLTMNTLSAQNAAVCEAGFRSFTHAMGESCIPESPLRVVVLDTGELDNALALGAPIIGAPTTDAAQYQAYLSDQLEGIADTGTISEPNFEAILALAPDLILGSKQRYEAIYEQLSQIAPTVFTESLRVPWQQNFNFHADALGKTAEAEELVAAYDAHVADLQAALGDALETTTISIVRFRPGQVRLYLKSSYIGYILQDVGLKRPASQDEDKFSAEISLEEVQAVDADYIFVTGYDVEDSERDTFLNSPLWQTLTAVQNGHVVDINDDTWIAGLGVQAANLVLDDLATLLADDSTQTAAITCEPGFRLFQHELLWSGTPDGVCIPEQPQRIAYSWVFHIPALIRGDFPFAGIGSQAYVTNQFPEWQAAAESIPEVGLPPNLEATLAVNPDLIIVPAWAVEENYEQISAIAPTVAFTFDGTHQWKQLAEMYFDIASLSDSYNTLMVEYESRAKELGALIGNPEEIAVSLVWVSDQLNLDTDFSVGGMVLADVGFARPVSQILTETPEEMLAKDEIPFFLTISWEQAQDADGDFIIAYGDFEADEGQTRLTDLQANPLWQALDGVSSENVYYTSVNWAGGDIAGAHNLLDDIARAFGVFDQLSANPYTLSPEAEATPAS